MFEDASWLVLIAILPLTYYVASMRERMKLLEKKLDVALQDYEVLRSYLLRANQSFVDERYSPDETDG